MTSTAIIKECFRREELEGLPVINGINYKKSSDYVIVEGPFLSINELKSLTEIENTIYIKHSISDEEKSKYPNLSFIPLKNGLTAVIGKRKYLNRFKI